MNPTYPDLRDRHVLITGGANGIGAAVCRAFAEQGARLSILDVDAHAGHQLAAQLAPEGVAARFHPVDLTDEAQVTVALNEACDALGDVDVLINNAARDPRHELDGMTTEQWDALFALNVRHYFLTSRHVMGSMRRRGRGSIIMVSSVEFWLAHAGLVCYAATKGAIVGMVKALANELGRDGVRVNGIAPGWVMTERQLRDIVTPQIKERLVNEWQALPYLLTPEMLAPVFLFLASDASWAVTRQTLLVDAGFANS